MTAPTLSANGIEMASSPPTALSLQSRGFRSNDSPTRRLFASREERKVTLKKISDTSSAQCFVYGTTPGIAAAFTVSRSLMRKIFCYVVFDPLCLFARAVFDLIREYKIPNRMHIAIKNSIASPMSFKTVQASHITLASSINIFGYNKGCAMQHTTAGIHLTPFEFSQV